MPNCPITKRAYQAKQKSIRTGLTVIAGKEFTRSYPDYSKTTIEEKFIKQGSD